MEGGGGPLALRFADMLVSAVDMLLYNVTYRSTLVWSKCTDAGSCRGGSASIYSFYPPCLALYLDRYRFGPRPAQQRIWSMRRKGGSTWSQRGKQVEHKGTRSGGQTSLKGIAVYVEGNVVDGE